MNDNIFILGNIDFSLSLQKNTNDTSRSLYLKINQVIQSKLYNEINYILFERYHWM